MVSANKPSHLRALLRKNWILWKRNWCLSALEFLIPLLFALIMVAFRKASPIKDVAQETFYNQPFYSFDYTEIINPGLIKNCGADENGGQVAIVPHPSKDTLAFDIDQALSKNLCYLLSSHLSQELLDTRRHILIQMKKLMIIPQCYTMPLSLVLVKPCALLLLSTKTTSTIIMSTC